LQQIAGPSVITQRRSDKGLDRGASLSARLAESMRIVHRLYSFFFFLGNVAAFPSVLDGLLPGPVPAPFSFSEKLTDLASGGERSIDFSCLCFECAVFLR